jgi:hypothetical protein
MKKLIAILTFVCLSTTANASNLDFTVNAGANIGTGSLVTDATGLATSGSLELTSGLVGIYSLFAGGPAQTTSPFGAFIYNNMTYNGAAVDLDVWGLLFVGNGYEINIWGNGVGNPNSFYAATDRSTYVVSSTAASFAPVTVPVPATVWLFGSAFLGIIGMGKYKRDEI